MINNIVVSVRVRLARNFENLKFPTKATYESAKQVILNVQNSVKNLDVFSLVNATKPNIQTLMMQEEMLISKDLINSEFGACLINADKNVSIMLNEEDHIRLQVILKENNLQKAYKIAKKFDRAISSTNKIAYDPELGFLTSCPTNLGTGMRASAMLFLPALTKCNLINNMIEKISKLGITVRGVNGEGSEFLGFLYQISNKTTLGLTEQAIINNVNSTISKIVSLEMQAREELLQTDRIALQDRAMRAYGVLKNCYMLSSHEYLELIGEVKFGYAMGFINIKDPNIFNKLEVAIKPAHLSNANNKNLNDVERDILRAEFVGKSLN